MQISEKTRRLIFLVSEGKFALLPLMYHFTKQPHCDEMLLYLYEKQLTGGALLEWATKKFANHLDGIVAFISFKMGRPPVETP